MNPAKNQSSPSYGPRFLTTVAPCNKAHPLTPKNPTTTPFKDDGIQARALHYNANFFFFWSSIL